jgi:hypothetical protein
MEIERGGDEATKLIYVLSQAAVLHMAFRIAGVLTAVRDRYRAVLKEIDKSASKHEHGRHHFRSTRDRCEIDRCPEWPITWPPRFVSAGGCVLSSET